MERFNPVHPSIYPIYNIVPELAGQENKRYWISKNSYFPIGNAFMPEPLIGSLRNLLEDNGVVVNAAPVNAAPANPSRNAGRNAGRNVGRNVVNAARNTPRVNAAPEPNLSRTVRSETPEPPRRRAPLNLSNGIAKPGTLRRRVPTINVSKKNGNTTRKPPRHTWPTERNRNRAARNNVTVLDDQKIRIQGRVYTIDELAAMTDDEFTDLQLKLNPGARGILTSFFIEFAPFTEAAPNALLNNAAPVPVNNNLPSFVTITGPNTITILGTEYTRDQLNELNLIPILDNLGFIEDQMRLIHFVEDTA